MDTTLGLGNIAIIFVSILLAVGMHESMHGFAAHWLGDSTAHDAGRLTLNPLKHVDILTTVLLPLVLIIIGLPPIFAAKPVPFNPYRVRFDEFGAALIGLAGPLTNLLLAVFMAVLIRLFMNNLSVGVVSVLVIFLQVNIGFFVFNMLPIPPLDGSRLLYAIAPDPVREFMARIEQMGIMVVVFFIIFLMPIIGPVITNLNQAILKILL